MFLLSTPFWKAARHISIIAFKDKIDTALANREVLDQPCLEVGCPGAGFKALSYSEFLNYFILVITKICSSKWKSLSCVQLFATHVLFSPWNYPGQNTGVGSLFLLQGIFTTQELNPGLPHCRWVLYQLSHKGSPRIVEWVTYSFSSGSSWPRNRTRISWITGGFFTNRAIREAPFL